MSGRGLTKVASFRSGQRKTFTMWANSKLIAGGHDPIGVENMADEFTDGTVLTYLLEVLTGKEIRGINRKPKFAIQMSQNLAIVWKFMAKEDIELGGINSTDIQGGNEKIVLALLWRYIMKYDLEEDAQDALLEWVQPRTEEHKAVQNFTSSWKDGIAICALFDSMRPGILDMAEITANEGDVEEHLAQAFELFEEHFGVPKMLEVQDLMIAKPDKKSIMTYIAAIKAACARDEAAQEAAKESANEGHKCKGEELFQQGNAKYAQAAADDTSCLEDIVKDAITDFEDSEGTQERYDEIIKESLDKLVDASERYDKAAEKFAAAKDEFSQVDDGACADRVVDCDNKISEVNQHKIELEQELLRRLQEEMKHAKGKKMLQQGNEKLDEAIQMAGGALEEALTEAYEKIVVARNEQERIKICNDAKATMDGQTAIFDSVKENYTEAERLLLDGPLKTEAQQKAIQCDDLKSQLRDTLDSRLAEYMLLNDNEDLTDEDLLAIYHNFSLEIEHMLDNSPGEDAVLSHEKGVARARLDGVSGLLKKLKDKQAAMRGLLHAALDASIDEQGL